MLGRLLLGERLKRTAGLRSAQISSSRRRESESCRRRRPTTSGRCGPQQRLIERTFAEKASDEQQEPWSTLRPTLGKGVAEGGRWGGRPGEG